MKIQILSRWDSKLIFECDAESLKLGVELAVKQKINLRGANLGGANLGDAYLRGANLGDAYLGDAYLRGANLGDAYLGGANLGDAYLRGANLGDAYLGDAYLRGANLGGANLRGANLGDAYLGGANLRGANLGDAYLRGANLGDAYLRGANLGGAHLRGAYLGDQVVIDLGARSDGYAFSLTKLTGEGWRIKAGCRNFTAAEARNHWQSTRGGTALGSESLAIVDHAERIAAIRGFDLNEAPTAASPAEQPAA